MKPRTPTATFPALRLLQSCPGPRPAAAYLRRPRQLFRWAAAHRVLARPVRPIAASTAARFRRPHARHTRHVLCGRMQHLGARAPRPCHPAATAAPPPPPPRMPPPTLVLAPLGGRLACTKVRRPAGAVPCPRGLPATLAAPPARARRCRRRPRRPPLPAGAASHRPFLHSSSLALQYTHQPSCLGAANSPARFSTTAWHRCRKAGAGGRMPLAAALFGCHSRPRPQGGTGAPASPNSDSSTLIPTPGTLALPLPACAPLPLTCFPEPHPQPAVLRSSQKAVSTDLTTS